MNVTKDERLKRLKRFYTKFSLRLKDQDVNDLPEWGLPFVPPVQEEETLDFVCFDELKFE